MRRQSPRRPTYPSALFEENVQPLIFGFFAEPAAFSVVLQIDLAAVSQQAASIQARNKEKCWWERLHRFSSKQ